VTTRQIGISLHEELDRREKLIITLQEECGAIRTTLAILERGGSTPEAQNRVTRFVGKRGRRAKSEGGGIGAAAAGNSNGPTNSATIGSPARESRRPTRRATSGALVCEKCGAADFPTKAGVSMHVRKCDGIRRTAAERKKAAMDRWVEKNRKAPAVTKLVVTKPARRARVAPPVTEPRMRLPMRPAERPPIDEDEDLDDGFGGPPTATPAKSAPESPTIHWQRCHCGEKFPDARALGIHQTRVHYGSDAVMSRRGVSA
jgi:hypothetical protein